MSVGLRCEGYNAPLEGREWVPNERRGRKPRCRCPVCGKNVAAINGKYVGWHLAPPEEDAQTRARHLRVEQDRLYRQRDRMVSMLTEVNKRLTEIDRELKRLALA